MVDAPLSVLESEEQLARALASNAAVLFKHSPACTLSSLALRQVRRFAQSHTEMPVYMIDILSQRELSDRIESTLGVRHQSPQVIVLQRGTATWSTSHLGVTAGRLARGVAGRQ